MYFALIKSQSIIYFIFYLSRFGILISKLRFNKRNLWIKCLSRYETFCEVSNNLSNDLIGINVCKSLEFCWYSLLTILQWTNTTLVISKCGTFSEFLSIVILLLVLVSNFINLESAKTWKVLSLKYLFRN